MNVYTCELTRAERRFVNQVVEAGLATRQHAMQVFKRNERMVIGAWQRALADGVTPATDSAATTSPTPTMPQRAPEQLELFAL